MQALFAWIAATVAKRLLPSAWVDNALTFVVGHTLDIVARLLRRMAHATPFSIDDAAADQAATWLQLPETTANIVAMVKAALFGTTPPPTPQPVNPDVPPAPPPAPRPGPFRRFVDFLKRI